MRPPLLDPRPYVADLPNPRRETQNKLHKLHDILNSAIALRLCRGETWQFARRASIFCWRYPPMRVFLRTLLDTPAPPASCPGR